MKTIHRKKDAIFNVPCYDDRQGMKVIAAWYGSRGLAYLSTAYYVFRLNCWVRNETRCFPKAMAAITTML